MSEKSPPGRTTITVLQMAFYQQRILLTEDKDFGELVVRFALPAFGIVLLRINPADTALKVARLRAVIAADAARLPGHFVVIDEDKSRFRPLSSP